MVLLQNHGSEVVVIHTGQAIAQLLIYKDSRVVVLQKDTLDDTARGDKGFGSTDLVVAIHEIEDSLVCLMVAHLSAQRQYDTARQLEVPAWERVDRTDDDSLYKNHWFQRRCRCHHAVC